MKNLSILIGGQGTNACAILGAIKTGALNMQCVSVICHRKDAPGIERTKALGAKVIVIDDRDFTDKAQFEQALAQSLYESNPDLIALAGFMRILSDNFVSNFSHRIINIHPSLLPKYKGLNTHQRALDANETTHGASVHWVTPLLDSGPVIAQRKVPILKGDTPDSLKLRVQSIEHELYIETLIMLSKQSTHSSFKNFKEQQF